MYKPALIAGILSGMLAVIIGAFGAHGIKPLVDAQYLAIYEKGVAYQFYHTFALLAAGILYSVYPAKSLQLANVFFIMGIAFFSGSLYAMALLKIKGMSIGPAGIITPIGGLFFIAGWISMLIAILKRS
jgi:uncharacterized membrane protein YgdD (TMEM256/DUF423 family)